jgi:non-canonical purine NTP pyrophosphatase (RdgB/HAM1 family)
VKDFVFITGNQRKADYLAQYLGWPIEHRKVDLEEIQSLDLKTVVEDKARRAYALVQKPVLVEDVSLSFMALGRLPGPLIRWFLEEMSTQGLCRIMQPYDDKRAVAGIIYGLFDGHAMKLFEAHVEGTVSPEPRSIEETGWKSNFGWNSVFIPDGSDKTYAQMSDDELKRFGHRHKAVLKLQAYLEQKST